MKQVLRSTKVNFGSFLKRQAECSPELEAVVEPASGLRWNFYEFNSQVNRTCHALSSLGFVKGDRLAIMLPTGADYVSLIYACAKIGVITVGINWRLAPVEIDYQLRDSGACGFCFDAEFSATVTTLREINDSVEYWCDLSRQNDIDDSLVALHDLIQESGVHEPDMTDVGGSDLLCLLYTSGTTGKPKGVMLSHDNQFWAVLSKTSFGDYRPADRFAMAMPLFHTGGMIIVLIAVYRGMALILDKSFDPQRTWETISNEEITSTLNVPAMLLAMRRTYKKDIYDISSLRWILTGGAPVPLELAEHYGQLGITIIQGYGLTETCGPACLTRITDGPERLNTTGTALLHTEVKIVDEEGQEVSRGMLGEIYLRGRSVMMGYWNDSEGTEAAFDGEWLKTGDVGFMDEVGYVTIADRKKDLIVSGGENIAPAELENYLLRFDGVQDAAVIGVKSKRWGESPLALVVKTESGPDEETIQAWFKKNVAGYKRIGKIIFTDVIRRNSTGKVLKHELRAEYEDIELP